MTIADGEIDALLLLLRNRYGCDFSRYLRSHFSTQAERLLSERGLQSMREYCDLIAGSPEEAQRLVHSVRVNYSAFFRDPLVFEFFASQLLPGLIEGKLRSGDCALRIWSAACARAEEAYSAAILVREQLQKMNADLKVDIFATDVDGRALKEGMEGLYPPESLEQVKHGLVERYFLKEGGRRRISNVIKDMVSFSVYDLLSAGTYTLPDSVYGDFDVILLRNLLIYLDAGAKAEVFEKAYRSLSDGGYLVLGEAEALCGPYREYFRQVNECCRIYKKTGARRT